MTTPNDLTPKQIVSQLKSELLKAHPKLRESGYDMTGIDAALSAAENFEDPRVLVVVSGGVADPVSDHGVDVEVFDWDNYRGDPEGTGGVPNHFSDLAQPLNVPVEPEEFFDETTVWLLKSSIEIQDGDDIQTHVVFDDESSSYLLKIEVNEHLQDVSIGFETEDEFKKIQEKLEAFIRENCNQKPRTMKP